MTDRPTELLSLNKLRYRWEHPDFFSEKETTAFTAGYRIAEHRLRHAPQQVHAGETEFDQKLSALYRSIEKDGLRNPLIVKEREGVYYCIVGNQRLAVLRGMATEAASNLRAKVTNSTVASGKKTTNKVYSRPLTNQEADSRISIPCIIALTEDSWNDWTEARLAADPLDAAGECTVSELRYRERMKYALIYEKHPEYEMGDRKVNLEKWIEKTAGYDQSIQTWLDVGCGRGETRRIACTQGFDEGSWHGTEVIESLTDPFDDVTITFGAHDLGMFDDQSFDIVTCCDVMEHILEQDTDASLRELIRVTRHKLYMTISWCESMFKDVGELHINRHLKEWWEKRIAQICVAENGGVWFTYETLDDTPDGCTFVVTR